MLRDSLRSLALLTLGPLAEACGLEILPAGRLAEAEAHITDLVREIDRADAELVEALNARDRAAARPDAPACTCGARPMTEVRSIGVWVCACGVVAESAGHRWRKPDHEHAAGLLKMAAEEWLGIEPEIDESSPADAARRVWKDRAVREAAFAARAAAGAEDGEPGPATARSSR